MKALKSRQFTKRDLFSIASGASEPFCFCFLAQIFPFRFRHQNREQKQSPTLDYMTGFHVIDGDHHIVVVEGVQEGAIERMLNEVPRTKNLGMN